MNIEWLSKICSHRKLLKQLIHKSGCGPNFEKGVELCMEDLDINDCVLTV